MNPKFRHHHLPGQPDDSSDTSQNGFGDSTNDPTNPLPDLNTGSYADVSSATSTDSAAVLAASSQAAASSGAASQISATGEQPSGFVIDASYDDSIVGPSGIETTSPTLYNEFVNAVNTAISFYEGIITNSMTIDITFGLGSIGGAGQSGWSYGLYNYTMFYNDLKAAIDAPDASAAQKAAFNSLPATDPTGGADFVITGAEQEALGLTTNPAGGNVLLSNTLSYSWTQPNSSGHYDAVGALEHEISEVMGRADFLGSPLNGTPQYSLLDFFHYSAAGDASNAAPGSAAGTLEEPFVSGYSNSVQTYFYDPVTQKVTLAYDAYGDGDVADWKYTVQNDSYGTSIEGETGFVSPTDLEEMNILGYDMACFLPGTQIATPSGEVAVEDLKVGDTILTHHGEARSVTWIGHGKALATRGRRNAATPVIVHKGALAENVPNRDLRITKGHSLYLNGVLIPAEFLVNHRSIVWDDRAREVEFYHIELAVHDVLLANGTPAESYREDGNRWMFQNTKGRLDPNPPEPCAPVLTGGPIVDEIWRRLLDRSGTRPGLPLTDNPDVHVLVDGNRIDPSHYADGVYSFRVVLPASEIRIVSRAGAPDELGLARDPRCLGIALRRIILWRGREPTVISPDDPCLRDGFHAYEEDNDFRWTDGDARLPATLFQDQHGSIDIELRVGCTIKYPLFEDRPQAAA